jgi:hypothetical protein
MFDNAESRCIFDLTISPCMDANVQTLTQHPRIIHKNQTTHTNIHGEAWATWIPSPSVTLSITKIPNATLLLLHSNDSAYYAKHNLQLHPNCPVGTTFIANYTIDHNAGETTNTQPRVLIYDMAHNGKRYLNNVPAKTRYEELRSLAHFLPSNDTVVLQWAGFYNAAKSISKKSLNLRHDIESVVLLSETIPGQLTRLTSQNIQEGYKRRRIGDTRTRQDLA